MRNILNLKWKGQRIEVFKIWGGYELKIIISSLSTIYITRVKKRDLKEYLHGSSVVTAQVVIDYLDNTNRIVINDFYDTDPSDFNDTAQFDIKYLDDKHGVIFDCLGAPKIDYSEKPPTIEWQGRTVRLGRPFEWNGRELIVFREVNDEKYGQVLITALNSRKAYIIGDSVVTDQAIIDYLDDNYGLPVRWRKIKF